MNAYQAIMAAADHIEHYGEDFDYHNLNIPKRCGSPGCVVGWIGHFSGQSYTGLTEVCYKLLGIGNGVASGVAYCEFEDRMNAIDFYWRSPDKAPAAMRAYAEQYHPQPKQTAEDFLDKLKSSIAVQTVSTEAKSQELSW